MATTLRNWRGPEFIAQIDRTMKQRMVIAAETVATSSKLSMKGGGSPHVPSRPGEPPHIDTGALRAAIHTRVTQIGHRVRGFVISPSRQSRALELGYPPHNLAPRPYLRPALARERARIRAILGAPVHFGGIGK